MYEPIVTVFTTGSPEVDKANDLGLPTPKVDKSGYWKAIPIYAGLKDYDMQEIVKKFTEEKCMFENKVGRRTSSSCIFQ